MTHLIKAFRLLDSTERRQAWMILGVVIVMALFDTLGTVSVMPFLAVIANPGLIQHNRILAALHDGLGFTSTEGFLFFLGLASFGLLIVSALLRAGGQYLVNRFTYHRSYTMGRRLIETYLRQPYAYYLSHHTGDMAKALLSEINVLIFQIYQPATVLLAQGVLLLVLLGLLIAVNPAVALIGMGVIGTCYALIYLTVRRHLDRLGHQRAGADRDRFRVVAEALGGIKTVQLLGRERHYLGKFEDSALRLSRALASSQTLSVVPRYAIEAIAFGGIILLTLSLMLRYQDSPDGALASVLPMLGLYAFAGYRIMPAIQGVYQAMSQMRFASAALDSVAGDLAARAGLPELPATAPRPLPFTRQIELKGVGFRHEGAETPSLSGISLTIPKGSTLGIVGSTGAGKTTLIDVFLGLLTPGEGEIRLDGTRVTPENVRAWQADLGYVPQDIFLLDASVAENIALGLGPAEIDRARVRDCARMAQILDVIETDLPQGFDTLVGERGVRLSGGQRQRIGIARALYHDPGILVFDEATSALDNLTETEVVRAINALTGSRTILLVAHRISTVRNCDQILVLDRGRVAGLGPYDILYETNAAFRRLVDARDAA